MWALGVEDDAVRKCVTRGAPCLGRDKKEPGWEGVGLAGAMSPRMGVRGGGRAMVP